GGGCEVLGLNLMQREDGGRQASAGRWRESRPKHHRRRSAAHGFSTLRVHRTWSRRSENRLSAVRTKAPHWAVSQSRGRGFLDTCDYLGYSHGERRWRSRDGEIEAFDR